jgi:DNA repair exonuclease SbcCD nuclease subunit
MKILAASDVHVRETTPRYRRDNYCRASLGKLAFAVETANEHDATLAIAGDLFDTSKASVDLLNQVAMILQCAKHTPICVAGQHDLRYHTSLHKTPLYNLYIHNTIKLLSIDDYLLAPTIRGISWGDEYSSGYSDDIEAEILLIHHCCTPDEPPFFLEDALSAKQLASRFPGCKYIISGDYHESFVKETSHGTVINCGTFMRNKKDMLDHEPKVFLIDTAVDRITPIKIPIEPAEVVFDIEAMEYDEKHGITIDMEKLRELMGSAIEKVEYRNIVMQIYKTMSEDEQPTLKLIDEVFDGIRKQNTRDQN